MAARTSKIACSLDTRLLASVERLRGRTKESRSAVIARALGALVEAQERALRAQAYVQAYLDRPESPAAIRQARRQAQRTLSTVSWDDA